jgi:hypothetical protein
MLEGFAKEYVMHIFLGPLLYLPLGIFHCHLVYFIAIWYISLPFGIFHCHLVYFIAIWYILWSIGIFFSFWYVVQRKNLATLLTPRTFRKS